MHDLYLATPARAAGSLTVPLTLDTLTRATRRRVRRIPGYQYLLVGQPVDVDTGCELPLQGNATALNEHGVELINNLDTRFVAWPDVYEVRPTWARLATSTVPTLDDLDGTLIDLRGTLEDLRSTLDGAVDAGDYLRQLADTALRIERQLAFANNRPLLPVAPVSPAVSPSGGSANGSLVELDGGPIGVRCAFCHHLIQPWHIARPLTDRAYRWTHHPGTCPRPWSPDPSAAQNACPRCGKTLAAGELVVAGGHSFVVHDAPCGECPGCSWPIYAGEAVTDGADGRWRHTFCPYITGGELEGCDSCEEPLLARQVVQVVRLDGRSTVVHHNTTCVPRIAEAQHSEDQHAPF